MTTASQVIDDLCRTLKTDQRIRFIDATAKRPIGYTGIEIARRVEQAQLNLAASGVAANDTVLFAIRPSITAVAYLQALIALGIRTVLIDLREPEDLVMARIGRAEPDSETDSVPTRVDRSTRSFDAVLRSPDRHDSRPSSTRAIKTYALCHRRRDRCIHIRHDV
jgi:acyl-CoA synthetase (AMP-forming)/AMP-acid ligase II